MDFLRNMYHFNMRSPVQYATTVLFLAKSAVPAAIAHIMPRKKNKLCFGAWQGKKFDCNPRALFEYLLNSDTPYECVWIGEESIRSEVLRVPGAKFARKGSFLAFWHCITSSYYVFNISFWADIGAFPCCGKVTRLALGHGIANKCSGVRQFNGNGKPQGEQQPTTLLNKLHRLIFPTKAWRSSSSALEGEILCKDFPDILTSDRVLPFGYCRNDFLVNHKNDHILQEDLKHKISKIINVDPKKKWYLYAPTWRHNTNNCYSFALSKRHNEFREVLRQKNAVLLEKHHPKTIAFMHSQISTMDEIRVLSVSEANQINVQELLLATNLLISDYSSIYFDFGLLNRPVIEYTYDYERARDVDFGFEFDLREYPPGPFVYSEKELLETMKRDDEELLRYRTKQFGSYIEFEKGTACKMWEAFIATK